MATTTQSGLDQQSGDVTLYTYVFQPDDDLETDKTAFVNIDDDFMIEVTGEGLYLVELSIGNAYNDDDTHSVLFQVEVTGGAAGSGIQVASCKSQKGTDDKDAISCQGVYRISDGDTYTFTPQWQSSTSSHNCTIETGFVNTLSLIQVSSSTSDKG